MHTEDSHAFAVPAIHCIVDLTHPLAGCRGQRTDVVFDTATHHIAEHPLHVRRFEVANAWFVSVVFERKPIAIDIESTPCPQVGPVADRVRLWGSGASSAWGLGGYTGAGSVGTGRVGSGVAFTDQAGVSRFGGNRWFEDGDGVAVGRVECFDNRPYCDGDDDVDY